jgi:hypothetical protein
MESIPKGMAFLLLLGGAMSLCDREPGARALSIFGVKANKNT